MIGIEIKMEDLAKILKDLKSRKAEMYRKLKYSEISLTELRERMKKFIEEGGEPEEWKVSWTEMITKEKEANGGATKTNSSNKRFV